ncbi:hypothetical protein F2P81_000104 [Scophthalmus maximus]|uniref:Uncharacterized protein n=1 Tax=Scophthalmus maximus TaxID=52904 RepID=A0A6A4TUX0_SCOMX|nr:hypothetical protein F2P81_000104 [Scophthalmus maximus]
MLLLTQRHSSLLNICSAQQCVGEPELHPQQLSGEKNSTAAAAADLLKAADKTAALQSRVQTAETLRTFPAPTNPPRQTH